MRYRRKTISILLVLVAAIGVELAATGSAYADIYSNIHNPPGYTHLMNGEWAGSEPRCLFADADTSNAEVWRCLNAPSEEWLRIPVSVAGFAHAHVCNCRPGVVFPSGLSRHKAPWRLMMWKLSSSGFEGLELLFL